MNKLQLVSNVFSANTLGAGSLLPYNKPAVVFDFLDPSNSWVVPVESGIYQYQPGIPEIKNGGLTSDSNIIDGRQWLATPFNTATDTLTLIPSGSSTPETRVEYLSKLLLLARQANAYNTQSGEFRPVNICVNEPGDAGDRYSQIDDIQYAISGDMFADPPNLQLTLTIIRYQFWTPVPLGTNPKVYTFLSRGLTLDDFLVPSELARFPDDISGYTTAVAGGGGAAFTVVAEGYTPDIGYGNTVIDWVSGTTANASIGIGNTGSGIANVQPSTGYILTYWIRSENSTFDAVPLRTIVTNQASVSLAITSNYTATLAAGWVKVQVAFTTNGSTSSVFITIQKNTSAVNASYDIYGVSIKLAANPLDLTEYGNANPLLRNWHEDTVENIWTREDPANLRLNYLDIPAADVPGDAPALLSMVVDRDNAASAPGNMYLGRRLDALSDEAIFTDTFMAEMSTLSSPAGITSTYAVTANKGISSSPGASATSFYAMQFVTGAGAISSNIIARWLLTSYANAGKVAVFARGGTTAGALADFPAFVRITTPGSFLTNPISIATQPRTFSNPTFNGLYYMGALDFTLLKNALKTVDGLGVSAINYTLEFVYGGRSAGAAATFQLTDIILMPYDDLMTAMLDLNLFVLSPDHTYAIMDNTGYFNQGTDGVGLLHNDTTTVDNYQTREVQGQFMTLEPNRNNRLYFLYGNHFDTVTNVNSALSNVQFRFRLNMIPQWRRQRSV